MSKKQTKKQKNELEIVNYNRFTSEIKKRRPVCCRIEYHLKQIALLINEPLEIIKAAYTGEIEISKALDSKLCDEFNRPLGYFLAAENAPKKAQNKPKRLDLIGQISMF
ncbi:MAG TPA: hypothetical protein VIL24_02410 [Clostridia bacterium]